MSYPAVVQLKPAPHAGQMKLFGCLKNHRFVLAPCGRRFGKTFFLLQYAFLNAVNRHNSNIWWVSPIQYQAKRVFRLMESMVRRTGLAQKGGILKNELRIELINGSVMEFHSGERGDKLRGEGVHLALLDEASLLKAALWFEALYPMLTDTKGNAVFAFTPQGQGHFTYKLYGWGNSADRPDYASIHLPTTANPLVDPVYVEAARQDLPEDSFRQEFLAEFLPDSSGVFRNIMGCVNASLDSVHTLPIRGPYVGGVDLAKHNDYTVIHIMDNKGRVCWHERMHRQDWPIMEARIVKAAKRYNAHLLIESNHEDAVIDHLREAGVSCEGRFTTGKSKQVLIQGLMVALEQSSISLPDIPELLTELSIFEYNRLPSGHIQYSAPEGSHDDEVMALALCVQAYNESIKSGGKSNAFLSGQDVESMVVSEAA